MRDFQIDIRDWLSPAVVTSIEDETLASLRITAGPDAVPLTEVEDTIAQTVRQHINVSAYSLARWLIINWWRLRWEPARPVQSSDWVRSHCVAAIGGDCAWPAIFLASDGEFIQLRLQAEAAPDVSAVRYLRTVTLDISAGEFEAGVDEFLDKVEARLNLRVPAESAFNELRQELRDERGDLEQAMLCRLQARAGIDPGAATTEWLSAAQALATTAGRVAVDEILAVTPNLPGGLDDAGQAISAMRASAVTVQLRWADLKETARRPTEIPWVRGNRLARELRIKLGLSRGPITSQQFAELLDADLPLPRTAWNGSRALRGGFRNGKTNGRTAVLVTNPREPSQRFYLARLAAAALIATQEEHVLPVSDAATALQKFERSFAQEFLCPWQDLDAFTDDKGTDDDGIADAATYFGVSEMLVLSTLVNKGKLPRGRLQGL